MTPRERRRYLWWLAGNRTEPEIPPGYVLAYLETLEHRLLIDLAAVPGEEIEANRTEARALTDELERLVELHDARRRISEAARKLAEAARIVHAFDGTTWHAAHPAPGRTPVDLARTIGQRLARGEEIPAGELLVWWKSQPGTDARETGAGERQRHLFALIAGREPNRRPEAAETGEPWETEAYAQIRQGYEIDLAPWLGLCNDPRPGSGAEEAGQALAEQAGAAWEEATALLEPLEEWTRRGGSAADARGRSLWSEARAKAAGGSTAGNEDQRRPQAAEDALDPDAIRSAETESDEAQALLRDIFGTREETNR